jgi:hypothetical protein
VQKQGKPGYDTFKLSQDAAGIDAFTSEEATAFLHKTFAENAEVATVEDAAKSMREFLNWRKARWD